MPQQIDTAIREMCSDAMSQAVAVLAEKYGFDAEDANRFLASDTLKIVRKRGPATSPKEEKSKSKSSPSKADKANKPKRGKTGYLLYADEVRAETKAELTEELGEDEKLKPQEVVKAIAAKWKAEDQDVRDEWNAKAKTPVTSDDEAEVVAVIEVEPEVEPEVESEAEPEVVAKPKSKKGSKKKKSLEESSE